MTKVKQKKPTVKWDNAPENATHALTTGKDWDCGSDLVGEIRFAVLFDCKYSCVGSDGRIFGSFKMGDSAWVVLETRPEKPVYTKEFVVRGGANIPEVWEPCEIVYSGSRYTVVKGKNGREYARRNKNLKIRDVDTRTPEEKAIDEISKRLKNVISSDYDDDVIAGIAVSILGLVGTEWVGE